MASEIEKHLKNIEFAAQEWEKWEKLEQSIKIKIISLELDLKEAQKKSLAYSKRTKTLILSEII